ncbi:MAG: O-antigen ligase family protein [Paludibacter sp.]|nr:O-antigen ligase family protein [Paludibacter sp.]
MPIILVSVIGVLLLCHSAAFDLIGFKTNNKNLHTYILLIVAYAPLALLFLSSHWREQKIHKKLLLLSLSALLIAVNYRQHDFYFFSILLAISAIWYSAVEKKMYRPTTFQVLLLIYFAIDAISICWTNDYAEAMYFMRRNMTFIFIPLIFCFFRLDKKDFDAIIPLLFRVLMLFAFFSICSWIVENRFLKYPLENTPVLAKQLIENIFPYDILYAWTNYMHPTYNAAGMMLTLCAGWFYVFRKNVECNITYCELAFFVVLTFTISILSQSRFMLVSCILVNVWGFFFAVRKYKKLTIASFAVLLILTFAFLFIFSDKITNFITDEARKSLYNNAFQAITENTWHGLGLGGMSDYIHGFLNVDMGDNPHNQLIGDIMQTGIFGLLASLSIIVYLLYASIQRRDKLLFVYFWVFLILMNIEMPLAVEKGISYFTLFFCFLLQRKQDFLEKSEKK